MDLEIVLHREGDVGVLKARGPATYEHLLRIIDALAEDSLRAGYRLAIIDLLEIGGTLNFTGQFQVGQVAARRLSHLHKLASLIRPQDITGTSQKVANREGLRLRAFSDHQAALDWLRSDER